MSISPVTTVVMAFAITVSLVEDSILYGLPFFVLVLINELLRWWALRE